MKTILVFVLFVVFLCEAEDTNQPISFRCITNGEFNNGHVSYGTVFWATNHTTNTFDVWLSAIEVKTASNWFVQTRPMQMLIFHDAGKPLGSFFLNPHAAGYATLQLSNQPTASTWRARVKVRPKLGGSEGTFARVKGTPSRLLSRFQTGETNIPMNPFSTNIHVFGKGTEVLSQEVLSE